MQTSTSTQKDLENHSAKLPAWDNSSEYEALHSPSFNKDLEEVDETLKKIEKLNEDLKLLLAKSNFEAGEKKILIKGLQDIAHLHEKGVILLGNLSTYANCEASLDSKNEAALKFNSKAQLLWARLSSALVPQEVFLKQCDESLLHEFLQAPHTQKASFMWNYERRLKPYLLSAEEEKTISDLLPFSHGGWGELYDQIAGSLRVKTAQGEIGVAQAAGILRGADEKARKDAWEGLQAAWKSAEVPCSILINNLVGYRLEMYKKRSHTQNMDFMIEPLNQSRIEAATLKAMMSTVEKNIEIPRRALRAMAKALNKPKIDPWDILAPSPRLGASSHYPFAEGLAMVRDSFASIDPKMSEFVDTMAKNNWLEARILPNKGPGAYCTGFKKSKTPRVFQSYMGSLKDISTLAHELGHAYHSWVMRDLSIFESQYPMTVAETASTFAETLLSERLVAKAQGDEKFTIAWEEASDAVSLLINIPARFEFEKSFYEARQNGALSASELSALTDKAWRKWYGEELSKTEEQYWMTKMHFNFSDISFYNYPYTFGYLFSLGIYAMKEKLGEKFHQAYVDLLRDSGRMSAEDLVQKHLGADIRQTQFWQDSINIVEKKVADFEKLV